MLLWEQKVSKNLGAVAWTMLWDFLLLALPLLVATGTSFLQPIPPQELLVAFSLFCLPQDLFTAPCPFAHRQLLLWLGLTPLPSKSWAASVSRGLLTMSLRLACAHV